MLSNVQVQLQLRKGFEHFNTSKHRAFKQWRCTLCFLAALWTTLDHTLFRRIIKPLGFYGLKGRLTLVLDINYVIWNVLPFTNAITFPNSQTDISIFEVVEATKMLNLIYAESVLWLLQLLFPSLGVSSMRILCPMKALTTSLKTHYRLKPLWFRKSTCMPYYTCRPSKKIKGLAASPAMINADLCYARWCNRSALNSKTPNFDT